MQKASFMKRAIGLLIDIPAMLLLSYLVAFLFAFLLAPFSAGDSGFAQFMRQLLSVMIGIVMILFQFLYFGFLWSRNGQSLGMKLMAIKVAREDGSRVGFFRSGLRGSVGYWISALVFFLGFIWAAFDKNGEAWHDKIFKTRVFDNPYDPYGGMDFPAPRPPVDAGPDMR